MSEAREPRTVIQAAEAAAEAGNHDSAETLLREAARLQEASLGPRHPDLANTLNNLGIVCEITGKPDDAEQYFRRAVSIARTSLHPDHPFVATSQKNLRDFCEARGRKLELPAPAPESEPAPPAPESEPAPPAPELREPTPPPAPELQEPAPPAPELSEPAPPAPEAQTPARAATTDPEPEDPEITSKRLFRRFALGALGPIAMLMVVLAAGLPRLGARPQPTPLPEFAIDSPQDAAPRDAAQPPAPAPVEASPAAEEHSTTGSGDGARARADEVSTTDIAPAPTAARPVVAAPPVVVRASLCGDLDDWLCDPADRPVPAGPLFFYTQIKSTSATTVQHRWYQNDRLHQTVKLHVQANRAGGYRTYSQNVMKSESAGSWRIEIRSEDGALLHEERFTVR